MLEFKSSMYAICYQLITKIILMLCILSCLNVIKHFFHLGKRGVGDASGDHVMKEKDAKIQVCISLFADLIF